MRVLLSCWEKPVDQAVADFFAAAIDETQENLGNVWSDETNGERDTALPIEASPRAPEFDRSRHCEDRDKRADQNVRDNQYRAFRRSKRHPCNGTRYASSDN
ncbi:hypothetical protein [Caballeronia temeraria]|uniref:hypothetical protein n=1 Tax=Caballeronia temeraria TaxID=1777137 RepID=UPI0012FDC18F|nr:hypothetical protein [Caballeronia temeraria]